MKFVLFRFIWFIYLYFFQFLTPKPPFNTPTLSPPLSLSAIDLGERLLASFNSPTGIPYSIVNLRTGAGKNHQWTQHHSILSEAGSVQLEFKALSYFTFVILFCWLVVFLFWFCFVLLCPDFPKKKNSQKRKKKQKIKLKQQG